MDIPPTKQQRLILFPLPFQGHINPMFQLAKILHSKSFHITIIHTEFNFPNPSHYPNFTFHSIPDGLSVFTSRPYTEEDIIPLIIHLNTSCAEPFRRCLAQILSDDRHDCVSRLITDAIWHFPQDVAEELKIRRITLRTSNICSFLAFAAMPLFRERGYYASAKMEDAVPEMPPLKVMDVPQIETENPDDLFALVQNTIAAAKRASAVIFNTFKELESQELEEIHEQFRIPIFAIGPFHKCFSAGATSLLSPDRSSIPWLHKHASKSVLYVSFGSIAALDQKTFLEVAWGLANSNQPFLWVIRSESSQMLEMLPKGLLDEVSGRSHIVKWAPQQEVLAHPSVGGFLTHGGWNSMLESICEGVPMICSAFFGDQTVNSRWASDVWRVGIKLEKGFERGEIEGAVRELMVGDGGAEMRKRALRLKEAAEACLQENGSSSHALEALVRFIQQLN